MPDPHQQTVASARHMDAELAALFAALGTTAHPRGAVLAAYRTARAALAGNVHGPRILGDVLGTLRRAVAAALDDALRRAVSLGSQQAERQAKVYGLPIAGVDVTPQAIAAYQAILTQLDQQIVAVSALAITTRDESLILGDENRAGVLSPAPVQREGRKWLAVLAGLALKEGMARSIEQAGAQGEFMRQAVAVIDQYTTDTCMHVNGQVRGLGQLFKLAPYTPRYADEMYDTPFHDGCRTSIAYVRIEDVADEWTAQLEAEAAEQLEEA